jgi:hypothetical protein
MKRFLVWACALVWLTSQVVNAQTPARDLVTERTARATRAKTLLRGDYVIDGSLTIITRQHKEALTLIPENELTYPYVRWINRAGAFMFGLTAHECKISKGQKFCDEHFTMYRGTDGADGKTGFWDAEFWGEAKGRKDMVSVQNSNIRMVRSDVFIQSPRGRRFKLTVSEAGVLSVTPAASDELHDDMEPRP